MAIASYNKKYGYKELSEIQSNSIQRCSTERKDNLYEAVFTAFEKRRYHNDCYYAYTSREKIALYLKKHKLDLNTRGLEPPSEKKLRR